MKASEVLRAVSRVTRVGESEIKSTSRKGRIAEARGIYFLACSELGIPNREVEELINRKHPTALLQSRAYRGAAEHDKGLKKVFDNVIRELSTGLEVKEIAGAWIVYENGIPVDVSASEIEVKLKKLQTK